MLKEHCNLPGEIPWKHILPLDPAKQPSFEHKAMVQTTGSWMSFYDASPCAVDRRMTRSYAGGTRRLSQ